MSRLVLPVALLAALACSGLVPIEERLPELCQAAADNANLYEAHAVGASPELVDQCVDWYRTWADDAQLATLECMAEAIDADAWLDCRPPYEPRRLEREGQVVVTVETDPLADIFGPSGLSHEMVEGIGGLVGARRTEIGSGGLGSRAGLGSRGTGLGGDSTTVGLGGLGTKGSGSGGYGSGGGHFGSLGAGGIAIAGDPEILGSLDATAIETVIRRHKNQIHYCYQRELTKDPSLAGELVVRFVIARDGSVSSAQIDSTTLEQPSVESCVVGRFMRMQFPEPLGGGVVIVEFPFTFSPGGT